MPTPTPPERLPGLKAALERFSDDDRASQKTLADLYGVAPSRFSSMVRSRFPEFPAAERQQDKTNWYPARAAIRSMIAYMENSGRQQAASRARATEIMTGVASDRAQLAEAAADAPAQLSASDIDRMASAQTKLWKLAKDKGQFVKADQVRDSFRTLGHILTRGVSTLPQRLDPNGMLPPLQRKAMEQACREMLGEMHSEVAKWIGADD